MRTTIDSFGLLVTIVAYAIFYVNTVPIFVDPDMPWHLLSGQVIRETGSIPLTNIWSFSAPEQPWYLLSWLWDVILDTVRSIAGLHAVYVLSLGFCAAMMGWVATHVRRRVSSSEALLLTVMLVVMGMYEFASARPQIAGYFFTLVFYAVLHSGRASGQYKRLYVLPLCMLLWVNMHGSFLVAFTLLGAFGLETIFSRNMQRFRQLLVVSVLCVVAVFINPYGVGIYEGVLGTLASSGLSHITEWRHFAFGQSIGVSAYLLVFVLALWHRDRKTPLADKLLAFAWLAAMLWSTRNAAIFMLVAAPYFARNLQNTLSAMEHIRTQHPDPLQFLNRHHATPVLALSAALLFIGSFCFIDTLKGDRYLVTEEKDTGAAIAYLQKHLQGKRVLNDYDMGGRIIYESNGTFPVFIDSRLGTAYPDALIMHYLAFLNLEDGWENVINKYKIDAIMIAGNLKFALAYDEGQFHNTWKRVYKDEAASIYVKK